MSHALRILSLYWLPLFLYVALIFAVSSFSSPAPFTFPDKLAHFIEYALLAAMLVRALRSNTHLERWWLAGLLSVFAVAILGGLDEWYQSTVPGRQSDILDLAADVCGGVVGAGLYLIGQRLWTRQKSD